MQPLYLINPDIVLMSKGRGLSVADGFEAVDVHCGKSCAYGRRQGAGHGRIDHRHPRDHAVIRSSSRMDGPQGERRVAVRRRRIPADPGKGGRDRGGGGTHLAGEDGGPKRRRGPDGGRPGLRIRMPGGGARIRDPAIGRGGGQPDHRPRPEDRRYPDPGIGRSRQVVRGRPRIEGHRAEESGEAAPPARAGLPRARAGGAW